MFSINPSRSFSLCIRAERHSGHELRAAGLLYYLPSAKYYLMQLIFSTSYAMPLFEPHSYVDPYIDVDPAFHFFH